MPLKANQKTFLSIVRFGIGHSSYCLKKTIEWAEIKAIAVRQGLSGVLIDGIERLPETLRPPKEQLLEWIGEVLQSYEYRYVQYRRAIAEMAGFYNAHDFKMMVLKGYACSLDWPKPEHRPCGDIDIWQFGRQKEADAAVEKEKGIKIDSSHHHHTVFYWRDFMVENHYDFVNVYTHRSNADLEKVFKELGQDDSHFIEVLGEKVYLPSPNLHALFLLRHMLGHFAAAEIKLRHVLDWAFFVEKHGREVDWNWLLGILEEHHMKGFFNLINGICVEDLGFGPEIFPYVQFNPSMKDRVLEDILEPEYGTGVPK